MLISRVHGCCLYCSDVLFSHSLVNFSCLPAHAFDPVTLLPVLLFCVHIDYCAPKNLWAWYFCGKLNKVLYVPHMTRHACWTILEAMYSNRICIFWAFEGKLLHGWWKVRAQSSDCTWYILFYRETLSDWMMAYLMLLLVFDVNHFLAVLALADISWAICLMQVNSIRGEELAAIGTLLIFLIHYSVIFKL